MCLSKKDPRFLTMLTGSTVSSPTVMVVEENGLVHLDGEKIMNSVFSSLSFRNWTVIQFLISDAQRSSLKIAQSRSPGFFGEKAKYS